MCQQNRSPSTEMQQKLDKEKEGALKRIQLSAECSEAVLKPLIGEERKKTEIVIKPSWKKDGSKTENMFLDKSLARGRERKAQV